jgi:hypothetical protein
LDIAVAGRGVYFGDVPCPECRKVLRQATPPVYLYVKVNDAIISNIHEVLNED